MFEDLVIEKNEEVEETTEQFVEALNTPTIDYNPRNPEPEELKSPEFNAVWDVIKTWDICPDGSYLYRGAMGNDVCAILDVLKKGGLNVGRESYDDFLNYIKEVMTKNQKRLNDLINIKNIHCSPGNEYMRGFANALILAVSIITDTDPLYFNAPEEKDNA
jgi:hypothetical protein